MNKELIEKIITYNYNEYGAEFGDALVYLKKENEWLHHIIKEVREYIERFYEKALDYTEFKEILEILDKENKE